MRQQRPARPIVPVHAILTFTALCQITLYLWYTGRITGSFAVSALAGVLLFWLLARAVREVVSDDVPDNEDCGPVTDWRVAQASAKSPRPVKPPMAAAAPRPQYR
jgi:hypothetical protein